MWLFHLCVTDYLVCEFDHLIITVPYRTHARTTRTSTTHHHHHHKQAKTRTTIRTIPMKKRWVFSFSNLCWSKPTNQNPSNRKRQNKFLNETQNERFVRGGSVMMMMMSAFVLFF